MSASNPTPLRALVGIAAGVAAGSLYFREGERGIPTDANCTYLAPASTDILAGAAAVILGVYGITNKSFIPSFIGGAIGSIHTHQFLDHKTQKALLG